MELKNICSRTVEIVKDAGNFIRKESKNFSLSSVEYKGSNDLVSYVDKQAEVMLVNALSQLSPSSGFITEEKTSNTRSSHYNWVIDPLDGTTNFVHGIPCYCVSVGLMEENELVLGVVYEINLDECFYAFRGGGAFMNGKAIRVSSIPAMKRSLLATGFPYSDYSRLDAYMKVFNHFMFNTHGLRRLGSAAADLAYVACGRFEGFYEYGLNAWDVAAGALIVKEAGGRVTGFGGGNDFLFGKEIVASNSHIHEEFLEVIKKEFT